MARCPWAKSDLMIAYHDDEWGVPLHDERRLFEMLTLEGAQAGLSWETILRKRDRYRQAFDGFDPEKVARYSDLKMARLLADPGIVRNRLKVASAVTNARAVLDLRDKLGRPDALDHHLWSFVGGRPIENNRRTHTDIPAKTPVSDAMSKDLQRRGFKFVGSTICYAFMQAVGMVNDHIVGCEARRR